MTQKRAVVAVVVLVILVVTLTPSGSRPTEPFSFCIACGPRGLADGILNLWLFVPLGIVLGWDSRPPATAILCGFLLSTAVELAQMVVPGRDPSLSDILFNTVGTVVGVLVARQPYAWLVPHGRSALKLTVASLVTVALVMIGTALLLTPAVSPSFVSRSGDDLLLRYTTRASTLGLDEPEYWLRGAWRGKSDSGRISVRHHRSRWEIDREGTRAATLGPTVGQGWTLLLYPNAIARRWGRVVNALWIAALCLPIGFWARGQRLPIAAALVVPLFLALIPGLTGVAGTSVEEWAGAGLGLLAGATLGLLSKRLARAHRLRG